jgi:tRNA-splicing ligase RtcB
MAEAGTVVVRKWLAEPLARDVAAALERLAESDDVRRIAVMPDVHLSADVCVGTVVATGSTLYPNAVGGDIGCGVAAIGFHAEAAVLDDERAAARVLAGLYRAVPFTRHGHGPGRRLPADLEARPLSAPPLEARKRTEAAFQVGTLGSGNHFVELQADDEGRLWLMLHSGSRGIGQAIRDHHLAFATPGRRGLRYLDAASPGGRAYLEDVGWALEYAEANRRALLEAVLGVVEPALGVRRDESSWVSCNHNHVRREDHGGEQLWVHRKGAMSAAPGEPGLLPGSMGTCSFHVEGRGCEAALGSSAHGAGRRMSRTDARRALSARDVSRELRRVFYDHRRSASLREEAPSAYKDVDAVLRAQAELVRVVRRLRPLLSFKGS